jgi:hypothetical protein
MKSFKIYVTSPCYDNIGKVLDSLKISYTSFKNNYDCDILFLNCGTSDVLDGMKLNQFVKNGGVLYASDLTSSFVSATFPNIFHFYGSASPCTMPTLVIDAELRGIIGDNIDIVFDMGGWSVLKQIQSGQIILKSATTSYPIMVMVPFGQGKIFYTCFHNHAQASEKEQILLKLLVLKQISEYSASTIESVSEELNINLSDFKNKFGSLEELKKNLPNIKANLINKVGISPTQSDSNGKAWDDFFTNQESPDSETKSSSTDEWNF